MNGLDIGQGGGKREVSLLVNSGKNSDKSVALTFHRGLRTKYLKRLRGEAIMKNRLRKLI